MRYLHTMLRVHDLDESLKFWVDIMGMKEVTRKENEGGRFTLVFLAADEDTDSAQSENAPMVELTYNWPEEGKKSETYEGGRNFGHLAYVVDDIYATCKHISDAGITINRPPRDGYMAFVKSPEGISIELLQKGSALDAKEPWSSMENKGSW